MFRREQNRASFWLAGTQRARCGERAGSRAILKWTSGILRRCIAIGRLLALRAMHVAKSRESWGEYVHRKKATREKVRVAAVKIANRKVSRALNR